MQREETGELSREATHAGNWTHNLGESRQLQILIGQSPRDRDGTVNGRRQVTFRCSWSISREEKPIVLKKHSYSFSHGKKASVKWIDKKEVDVSKDNVVTFQKKAHSLEGITELGTNKVCHFDTAKSKVGKKNLTTSEESRPQPCNTKKVYSPNSPDSGFPKIYHSYRRLLRRWTISSGKEIILESQFSLTGAKLKSHVLERKEHVRTDLKKSADGATDTGDRIVPSRESDVTQDHGGKKKLKFARCSWSVHPSDVNGGSSIEKEKTQDVVSIAEDTTSTEEVQSEDFNLDEKDIGSLEMQRTIRITRRFVVNGKEVKVSSSKRKAEPGNTDNKERTVRRQELQQLRVLQKEEMKAQSQLEQRMQREREIMFRHIEQEIISKKQYYEREIEALERQIEQARARREQEHTNRLQQDALRIKAQHQKERNKKKVDLKDKRQEERFLVEQQQELNSALQKVVNEHKKKVMSIERENLCKIHSLKKARESVILRLEERHLQEKYQLFRHQVIEQYALQKHQLRKRHEKNERLKHLSGIYWKN
ncbi:hypothetical protein GDO81_009269 [Engystomops pustulosus]|uniref:Non-specific serine/threonine protein kinase n=1 Tax=Engystomops pustulosus TaxID=76066 RepID=A0AAV7BQT1_ENGPU|nr:hypothetical protein GDO81_009269 [Engystomops pustulosus]